MEENTFVLSNLIHSAPQEPETGLEKAQLKVRLAPDMDEAFLQRLNKVCSSFLTENPSSRALK